MVLPDLVDVFVNCLEAGVLLRLLRWLPWALLLVGFYLVHQIREDLVSPEMEKALEYLVLVVEIVHLDDERVYFLNLVDHVQVLLRLDRVQYPFRLLTQLWELQERGWGARLGSAHNKVDHLGLA